MAVEPIKINDYNGLISNSRQKHMDEQRVRNNEQKFIFNKYQTEKSRIVIIIIII